MESQPESKQNLPPLPLKRLKLSPSRRDGLEYDPERLLAYTEIHNGGIVPSSTDAKRSKLFEAEVGD